ncbi:MAG TPA: c-type cytochrome [Steroidobacteraceae bacterium]|nr:c-type cytochrome [Steroidobacteraceae bacterium]
MIKRAVYAVMFFAPVLHATWAAGESQDLARVLGRTPDAARGAKLYETCAACHGAQGQGVSDGSVPAIAGQPFSVLAKQLVAFRTGERADERMQHFSDTTHLAYSQEVADVAAYVSGLTPRSAPAREADAGGGRGAILYIRKCERCHGAMAEGNGMSYAPRLAGQHASYLVTQLSRADERPALKEAHKGVAESLSREDIAALAAMLSSL